LRSPLSWLFAIREQTNPPARFSLWAVFTLLVFSLWVYATDYPQWLKHTVVMLLPQYQLEVDNPVALSIDRQEARLEVTKVATGRTIVRGLPPIAAEALPALTPANYANLFRKLETEGLGEFVRETPEAYRARIVDAGLARMRLRDLGPQPFQLPVSLGETVHIEIDFLTHEVRFRLDRIPRGGARAPIALPPEERRRSPRLEDYPELPQVAAAIGVGDLRTDPEAKDSKKMFQGRIVDPELAQASGLGPRRPIEPLQAGEEVLLTFKPNPEQPAAHTIELSLERTGKTLNIPFTPGLLAPAAIPALRPSAYPSLPNTLEQAGLRLIETSTGPQARVANVELARAAGLGLTKPLELRVLPRNSLPSPTEVIESLPVLWTERELPQATWLTLQRIFQGFAWAVVVCLPLGLCMGAFSRIGIFFEPLKLTGMYIPLPALIPLTIAWVGIGEPQIVLFLAICTSVVLLPYVVASVEAVPQGYLDTARTLGATRGQIFRYVLLAISWPTLFKGLKLSFAVGWTWIMLAEVIGVQNGLGYIINTSQRRGYIEHVYIVIVLVIGMAFLSNALWNLLNRILFPYEEKRG
jgi:NitT/TauT family transport system permease protein